MDIKIETNVAMPAKRGYGMQSPIKKALVSMEIGESFFVEMKSDALSNIASNVKKDLREKNIYKNYSTRKEENGARIWRVECRLAENLTDLQEVLIKKLNIGDAVSIKQFSIDRLIDIIAIFEQTLARRFEIKDDKDNSYSVHRIS